MKIKVNQQSKGKPENKYPKPTGFTGGTPITQWHEFENTHPELICLTPTGELAGKGTYETDGDLIWQIRYWHPHLGGCGNWMQASEEVCKWSKDTSNETRQVYIVTTPANEQPKEYSADSMKDGGLVIFDIDGEKYLVDTNRDFKAGYQGICVYANGDGSGKLKLWLAPYIPMSSGAKYYLLAASKSPLFEDLPTIEEWYKEYSIQTSPAPSLAPVDESVEERAALMFPTISSNPIVLNAINQRRNDFKIGYNECIKEHVRLEWVNVSDDYPPQDTHVFVKLKGDRIEPAFFHINNGFKTFYCEESSDMSWGGVVGWVDVLTQIRNLYK